jgi:hypothetical protein
MKKENNKNFILTIPKPELSEKVGKEKQIEYNNVIYKHGSKVSLSFFGKTFQIELFFDENKKMLMFNDPDTKHPFNFLGYIENVQL